MAKKVTKNRLKQADSEELNALRDELAKAKAENSRLKNVSI